MIKYPINRTVGMNPSNLMGSPALKKRNYTPYNHTDACRLSRWTTKRRHVQGAEHVRKCPTAAVPFQYLTYSIHDGTEIIEDCDKSQLASVTIEDRTGRWARVTFKIVLSYHGSSFDGWQRQPGLNTVQAWVEKSLGKFVDEKKAQLLKEKNLPIEGCAVVAGRTDKGVSALKQVCSFNTWRKDIKAQDVEEAINGAAPGKIRVVSVSKVSREFHPNFSAKWRRYLYILPLNNETEGDHTSMCKKNIVDNAVCQHGRGVLCIDEASNGYAVDVDDKDEEETGNKPTRFLVSSVNHLLHQLEGKLLSYRMFARDTKASRNIGPPTECFVFHARAAKFYCLVQRIVFLSGSKPFVLKTVRFEDIKEMRRINITHCARKGLEAQASFFDGSPTKMMCIELVANRFSCKMVRVLVATAVREAAAGAEEDALLKLMDATCRRATAPPAPPDGLCLLDVGYTEFDKTTCLIP